MSTQIFINPSNQCKPEYTKIAAHSFGFSPSNSSISDGDSVYVGGGVPGLSSVVTWSPSYYDYKLEAPYIKNDEQGLGVVSPINLVSGDVVTLGGTAYFNNAQEWIANGWDVYLLYAVFYFNCKDLTSEGAPLYTFIPLEGTDPPKFNESGVVCFSTDVTLGSNYDKHDTRFVSLFTIIASCNGDCSEPLTTENLVTVSYTFDIDRPCAVITSESNFIIRNCCEPVITELVNIPGLQVGSFHVDDEGNCWEVISASQDVTNFTRNFLGIYTSCVECQTANPCPQNLSIDSCCVMGTEFVTGSLPGLNVGDTFVDNHGLCWYVNAETGAPISEESIIVVSEIIGDCDVCTAANPCPDFWNVISCCGQLRETIATSVALDLGDSFVDTNGICWSVDELGNSLPTNYDIVVDTVYSMTPTPFLDNCEQCIFYNPCPLEYFLTIRMCCDNDRVEVTSVPSAFMSFSEGSVFRDQYNVCWEVMSYSTTGVDTYPLNFFGGFVNVYPTCDACLRGKGGILQCILLYQVRDCNTDSIYTAGVDGLLTVGSYYISEFSFESCFEILGYGYPTVDPLEVFIGGLDTEFATCEECNASQEPRWVQLQRCCADDVITAQITGVFPVGQTQYIYLTNLINPTFSGDYCCTLLGPGTPQPPLWTGVADGDIYEDCPDCTSNNGGCIL
jgi:hypothetical protein